MRMYLTIDELNVTLAFLTTTCPQARALDSDRSRIHFPRASAISQQPVPLPAGAVAPLEAPLLGDRFHGGYGAVLIVRYDSSDVGECRSPFEFAQAGTHWTYATFRTV